MNLSELETLRQSAVGRQLPVYEVNGGLGVRFSDGFDVYWVLPGEHWYDFSQTSDASVAEKFAELDEQRLRAIDAVRRYLAQCNIVIHTLPNGSWILENSAEVTCEIKVGVTLTESLTCGNSLVTAVQDIFKHSVTLPPDTQCVQQLLAEYGTPFREQSISENSGSPMETPLAVLQWIGLCRALGKEENIKSPEAFTSARRPEGRVGLALQQFARRLPYARAAWELTENFLLVDFSDEFDSFTISPRSSELRQLIRSMGPEQAGDYLADRFTRLDAARRQVLNAVFSVLNRQGYVLDSQEENYVGREVREFTLDLGANLTSVIDQFGEEVAVRQVLGQQTAFARDAIGRLGASSENATLVRRPLRRAKPAARDLPSLTEAEIADYDEWRRLLLAKFMKSAEALSAFFDPLRWDSSLDSWAQADQWRRLAQKHVVGKFPRPDAESILVTYGESCYESQVQQRLHDAVPHFETCDQDVEMMWRLRNDRPELAAVWFGPGMLGEDVPFAEVRARLGDPIAARFLLDSWNDFEDEVIPPALARIPRSVVLSVVEPAQLREWQLAAEQWAFDEWQWERGAEPAVLAAAANLGWREVADRLAENPFLVSGLLDPPEGEPGLLNAGDLFLAWSKLKPSLFFVKLLGFAMGMDRGRLAKDYFEGCLGISTANASERWTNQLDVALAISWCRCRRRLSVGG